MEREHKYSAYNWRIRKRKTAGAGFGTCKQSLDAPCVALIINQFFPEMQWLHWSVWDFPEVMC